MESKGSADDARRKLAVLMREDAGGIARDITDRMKALGGRPGGNGKLPEGLEGAVRAALEQAFRAIEGKKDRHAPPEVIAYSRKLAEEGFDTAPLMRRCYQCLTVFKEHLRQADASIKGRSQGGYAAADKAIDQLFERLQEAVEEAHRDEDEHRNLPSAIRLREEVRQALSGKLHYLPEHLGYDAGATHIGVVGSGPGVEDEIRRLAKMLGGQLLIVQDSPSQFWAWIGFVQESSTAQRDDVLQAKWDPAVRMGVGEPAPRFAGWRHTHWQAAAAFSIAIQGDAPLVLYAEVALLAATSEHPLLPDFLWANYLAPLATTRDGGAAFKDTLRAYFSRGRQASSAAEALGVKRHTVRNRLDEIEKLIGRSITSCTAELELALQIEELLPSSPTQPLERRGG